ncbi:MAG: hypothetical protein K2N38_01575 [Oscillospiraceae bacterium]|nr:hypothetical protein [Oscillospiraceae bacterium]
MRSNSRFLTVFTYVILAGCLLWIIVSGAANLLKSSVVPLDNAKPGDLCEFSADWAELAYEVTHYAEFIPVGKDQFYLTLVGDELFPMLVRAKPSWIEKRFSPGGGAVKIRGTLVGMDYKLTEKVRSLNDKMGGDALNEYYYIDVRYKEFGLLRLASGIGIIVFGAMYFFGRRSGVIGGNNKVVTGIFAAAFFVFLLFSLYALGVGGSGV